MATKKQLIQVAEELNEVLGLEPAISLDSKPEELKGKISQAIALLTPEDELTEASAKILDEEFPNWDGEPEPDPVEEEDEVEKPKKAPKPPKAEKKEKAKKAPAKEGKGPGVIATIAEMLQNSGEEGISKAAIVEELVKRFPDREEKSLKATVNVQVPARISKEKFKVVRLENGNYKADA